MSEELPILNVTKTYLPPLEEYLPYLQRIWGANQLTNHGPLVQELEERLKTYLGVRHLFFVSNGTIALQIGIKALGLAGEVITTPFSYVATASTLVWEGCRPVFADIDPDTLTIDPERIEAAITPRTTAIMAVHVYGGPCHVERIKEVADRHGLKVIYDAAHAFGTRYKGESLLRYGDISALSFHATKLFHTSEGGAIITEDDALAHRISYMRNFGHRGQEDFWGLGINGKNTEMHAAMGLCMLSHMPDLIARRKAVAEAYDRRLAPARLRRPGLAPGAQYNYAYYPVLFPSEEALLAAKGRLNAGNIFPRRYFYPSLNRLPYLNAPPMPLAEDAARRALCLPYHPELTEDEIDRVCKELDPTPDQA